MDHLDLHRDALSQLLDVADDTHLAMVVLMQLAKGLYGLLQVLPAEGAEALVDKEGVHLQIGCDIG